MTLVLFIFLVMHIWESRPEKYKIVHMVWSHCYWEYRRKSEARTGCFTEVGKCTPCSLKPSHSLCCVPGWAATWFLIGYIHCCGSGERGLLMFPLWQCFSDDGRDPLVGNRIKLVRLDQHWKKSLIENVIGAPGWLSELSVQLLISACVLISESLSSGPT